MATVITRRRHHRSRASERGAAVFIVVLLITMLTAVGFFAAHSASLSTQSSGHIRQGTQAHYLAEFALNAAVAEIQQSPQAYLQRLRLSPDTGCEGTELGDACVILGRETLEQRLGSSGPMLDAPASPLPGSLGWTEANWNTRVYMSEPMPAMPAPAGYDESGGGTVNLQSVRVTLRAWTIVYPGNTPDNDVIASSAIQERLSSHIVLMNVPKF
jgi:hypothetical protein